MTIALFHKIETGVAIVRLKRGVHKQVDMYARNGRVFIPHGGGYVRIVAKFGDTWGTAHPDIAVLEFEAPGVNSDGKEPRYNGAPMLRAV